MPKHPGRKGVRRSWTGSLSAFTPVDLGASLYDMWDAENASSLTLVGSAVSAWASVKNGYSAAQSTSGSRPVYSSTSFNGRPGLTFDGVDDCLTYAGVGNFPTGSAAGEVWALVDQTALQADIINRRLLSYGAGSGTDDRQVLRYNATGLQRINANIGTGGGTVGANNMVPGSGRLAIRAQIGSASTLVTVNGIPDVPVAAVPATGTVRTRIGANSSPTPAVFWQGQIAFVAMTAPLTTEQAGYMFAYLQTRGGI